jgi:PleD family two-component response regulator
MPLKNFEKCILVADENRPMREIITNYLKIDGYRKIYTANNGVEALAICRDNEIDLILCDYDMPIMGGLELLKTIRLMSNTSNIAVIMVTAHTKKELVNEIIDAGVTDFIVKPFIGKILKEKIDVALYSQQPLLKKSPQLEEVKLFLSKQQTEKQIDRANAKVLVVDDLSSNIDIIVGILKKEYKIRAAKNGKLAIQIALSDNPPDLILLDIMMPEMDGFEVCHQLKNNYKTRDIPIIFLSAKTDTKSTVNGFALGAVDYITKPVDAEILKARVKNQIVLRESKKDLKKQIHLLMENERLQHDLEQITILDIKEPLSVIINQSTLLSDNKFIGMEFREKIKIIESSGFDILNTLNLSLDLYKMETGSYQVDAKAINILELLEKIRSNNLKKILDQNDSIKIHFKESSTTNVIAKGEELLCGALLVNLIKYAIELSPQNDIISINVIIKHEVLISIHCNKEISMEIQNQFFDKYQTIVSQQGIYSGLYSAKMMAKTQGGDIELTSSQESGTTLLVSLPIWQE